MSRSRLLSLVRTSFAKCERTKEYKPRPDSVVSGELGRRRRLLTPLCQQSPIFAAKTLLLAVNVRRGHHRANPVKPFDQSVHPTSVERVKAWSRHPSGRDASV